jgi:hypothetical protein
MLNFCHFIVERAAVPRGSSFFFSVLHSFPVRPTFKEKRMQSPHLLYHVSPSQNRESIFFDGLKTIHDRTGSQAIFLSDTPPDAQSGMDVWLINASDLHLEPDHTGEPKQGHWFMVYGDIDANELALEKLRLEVVQTVHKMNGQPLYRVRQPATGEESSLYTQSECTDIVFNAQKGQLLGSFLAGAAA